MKKILFCNVPMSLNAQKCVYTSDDYSVPVSNTPVMFPVNAFFEKTLKPEDEIKAMVKRNAIFSAVTNVCKGYDYSITESKSTDSIYVKIHYGKSEICMRFSDHKGKSKNLKWFDYTAPKAKYGDMVRYIENRIKMVKYISLEKSLALIAA